MTLVVPNVVFNLAAVLLTIPILVSAVRQPLKRRYHYYFIGVLATAGLASFVAVGVDSFLILVDYPNSLNVIYIQVQSQFRYLALPLLYGFAAYFLRPSLSRFQ